MACRIFKGDDGVSFGVLEDDDGFDEAVLYEADFEKDTAKAIVKMLNSHDPPEDWFETKKRLKEKGIET